MSEEIAKKQNTIFNLPNSISFFRLLLAVPFYILVGKLNLDDSYRYYVLGLIFIAFISDILDGYIARKKDIVTETGKIIDPLADKVCVILIILQLYLIGEIPTIYFWIILGRDILIFTGGIFVSKKIGKVLPSNLLGKLTVLVIGFFIIAVVAGLEPSNLLYKLLFYISIIMSFGSVIGYALRAYEKIKWKNE